jgi:5-methylcytosine-specific restriction endonuclease McrA
MARRVEGLKLECTKCGLMLPRGWFRARRDVVNGRDSWCRECRVPGHRARAAVRQDRMQGRGSFTAGDIRDLWRRQFGLCAKCGISLIFTGYHVDHVIPIVRGGRNEGGNLQLLCPRCNLSKGAK